MHFLSALTSILGSESRNIVSSVERISGINSGTPGVLGNIAFFLSDQGVMRGSMPN